MNIKDFNRIVTSFADSTNDISFEKGKLTAIIRGDIIEIELMEVEGELIVQEGNDRHKAIIWIANRLALMSQLADRIKDYTTSLKEYINPTGRFLDDINKDPTETETVIENVTDCLKDTLGKKTLGTTTVVYLTSDAGEGKTTIINHLAISQADLYKQKRSDWLLVPIPMGGRPFLRFDDIVIASLVNRLRFRFFYYESFIELVKLGLIVPAFDGFEEMFMEGSTGEAISATGHLMSKLESSGNVLIAARQAYFDYKDFSRQARLFDSIGTNSVSFSKLLINRWSKEQFIQYAKIKEIQNSESIYDFAEKKLGDPKHPLLTRPVLINRLLDVIKSNSDLDKLSSDLAGSTYYFPTFVDAIIVREAETKWLDRTGEASKPLLTVSQHYDLLSNLAEEMWLNNTDSLQESILDLISELFCESNRFSPSLTSQVKERIKQHALIVKSDLIQNQFKFDHEEFKEFFLGISFFNKIKEKKTIDFKNLMRRGTVHTQTAETIIAYWKRDKLTVPDAIQVFNFIQQNEGSTSYIKENSGNLVLRILDSEKNAEVLLNNYIFVSDSLRGKNINNIIFKNCFFQSTSIGASSITNCLFNLCFFDSIQIDSNHVKISNCKLNQCNISSVQNKTKDISFYDPFSIKKELANVGFQVEDSESTDVNTQEPAIVEIDRDLEIVERALRRFLRSTHINDSLFRIRLAGNAEYFIKELLPILIDKEIIEEVHWQGGGVQRRFKLGIPFDKINFALMNSKGSFQTFLEKIKEE